MEDYPHFNAALAHVIRYRREELGLSKRRLAELAKLERVYIIQMEHGDQRPTLNAIFYLCDALAMTKAEFIAATEVEMAKLAGKYNRKNALAKSIQAFLLHPNSL